MPTKGIRRRMVAGAVVCAHLVDVEAAGAASAPAGEVVPLSQTRKATEQWLVLVWNMSRSDESQAVKM